MRFQYSTPAIVGVLSVLSLFLTAPLKAQDKDPSKMTVQQMQDTYSLPALVGESIKYMQAGRWDTALKLNEAAVAGHGEGAMQTYGPRFGGIYYRKGICELKFKKYGEAMKSFEKCYVEFHNNDPDKESTNQFHKQALRLWGEAAVGAEQWELALEKFKKFLLERDKRKDKFTKGPFYINLALCYYNLGDLIQGNENLEIAMRNKLQYRTQEAAIIAAFQAMVKAAIEKENEQAMLDFIKKNRGEIIISPHLMHQYAGIFMQLAADAIQANMERAALVLYQMVPSTEMALTDNKAMLEAMNGLPQLPLPGLTLSQKNLEKQQAVLEEQLNGKQSMDIVKLAAIAFIHEKHGNVRGAYVAYEQLEKFYKNAEKREDYLYNLVRTAFSLDTGGDGLLYGNRFLKEFPNSDKVNEVRRMMLTTLFANGEYETCIERASVMINEVPEGTAAHDMCLHVLGGSYYFTAQYEKAQEYLDKHVALYPDSSYAIAAMYFQASNIYRRGLLPEAGPKIDAFMEKYSDPSENVYLPFAMYDRGTVHYQLQELEQALKVTLELIDKFPDANVIDQAYNQLGNIHFSLEDEAAAEKAYLKALAIAEERGNGFTASEAINSIVTLKVAQSKDDESKLDEALPFVDKFWKEYADDVGSGFRPQISMVQVPVLVKADRLDEALERLKVVIQERAKDPNAAGMEMVLGIYTEAYLMKHTSEQLKDHYNTFPKIDMADRAARALLRIATIQVFENDLKEAKKANDDTKVVAANARIKVEFQNLKSEFDVKDLASSILVKVGNYLRTKTSTPREALPFYNEAIERNEPEHIFGALLGRADIYGKSANPADIAKGLEDFRRVFKESEDRKEREFSLYRIVELLMAKGEHQEAADRANEYLAKDSKFGKYKPQVGLMLAQSFDKRNMTDDAIAMYMKIWSVNMGNISVSAPAMTRYMELLWQRNKAAEDGKMSDRQGAYMAGAKYTSLTGRFKDKMSDDDLELWRDVDALVKRYEQDKDIKSMEEIERENEE